MHWDDNGKYPISRARSTLRAPGSRVIVLDELERPGNKFIVIHLERRMISREEMANRNSVVFPRPSCVLMYRYGPGGGIIHIARGHSHIEILLEKLV